VNISLCDISKSDEKYKPDILKAIADCIQSNNFIKGKAVKNFEKEFAEYLGVKHAIGVSSCTMALYIALRALDVGQGDEVIIPDFTIAADIEPVLMCGAIPVICEVLGDGNIDPDKLERKISHKTKAIILVHLYGKPCDMDRIVALRAEYKIPIIEDCAQSFGSEHRDIKTGSITDISCHSFFPSKVLACYGDGGMIATDDDKLAEKCMMLGNHGRKPGERYKHELVGLNSRLPAFQAAVLSVKLKHIDEAIEKRRIAAKNYTNKLLKSVSVDYVVPPAEGIMNKHVYYMYSIQAYKRDELLKHLLDNGIKASIHYPIALSQHPIYAKYFETSDKVPVAHKLAKSVLSLPIYPGITEEQINYVVSKVAEFYE